MHYFKQILPIGVIIGMIAIVGIGGYFIGKNNTATSQGASLYNAKKGDIDTWWPAGSGFCYKRVRNQWGAYWYLGEISGLRCVDITMPNRMTDLENLMQQKALQLQDAAPAIPATKTN